MGQVIDIKNLKADLLNLKKQGEIYPINNGNTWNNKILQDVEIGTNFYFVH